MTKKKIVEIGLKLLPFYLVTIRLLPLYIIMLLILGAFIKSGVSNGLMWFWFIGLIIMTLANIDPLIKDD